MTYVKICLLVRLCVACGTEPPSDDVVVNCDLETRADDFVVGIEKSGQAMTFRLVSATPAPPARGDNSWELELVDPAGPVSGATVRVSPFMPDHQHGTAIDVITTPLAEPGRYELAPINLWMPALWETTIEVTTGTGSDSAVFRFCIPA